ncbi:hypothetical protein EDB83DRAFT_644994 [Lactarius deliciosus]|nr:hypothetical protein EDB83DRAFT_644994 [Lactarius deliciosus]
MRYISHQRAWLLVCRIWFITFLIPLVGHWAATGSPTSRVFLLKLEINTFTFTSMYLCTNTRYTFHVYAFTFI